MFVLGVRLSADAARGATDLQTLLPESPLQQIRIHAAAAGLGRPTTRRRAAPPTRARTMPMRASTSSSRTRRASTETDDWLDKRDGQWLAEALGLDTEWLKQIPNAGAVDQSEARAMNTALWPATLGYFMDTLLKPVFDDDAHVLHALVLQPLRQRPRRRFRPCASAGSRTASCPRRRSAACAGPIGESPVPHFAVRDADISSSVRARSRAGCGSDKAVLDALRVQLGADRAGRRARRLAGRRSAPDAARYRGPASRLRGVPPALCEHARSRSTTSR